MVGFGQGSHWDKTYDFFLKGNERTYKEILKLFYNKCLILLFCGGGNVNKELMTSPKSIDNVILFLE
jgi:hypothetical protein